MKTRTDTERLDALQSMITKSVVCRSSVYGRGWRLHECDDDRHGAVKNIRYAIDTFLDSVNENQTPESREN